MKRILMKKGLLIGAVALLLASCSARPHYGCRGGRCIVEAPQTQAKVKADS